jgi:methyltransferase (TIGR00027 family)
MTATTAILHDISDTARWAAVFRAGETERPDALFRDPFATRLAGPRGFEIAGALSNETHATSWVIRTYLFDQLIAREIQAGADVVVNLGAGLDARPYRMELPSSLQWIEADGSEILRYKDDVLRGERPRCRLERVALDLRDRDSRSAFFRDLNLRGNKILVVCEGVLIYFQPGEAAALAGELAGHSYFERWILEVVSPAVLDNMNRTAGADANAVGISFQFGPPEGPAFFGPHGWSLVEGHSVLKTAIRLGRTPLPAHAHQLMPDVPADGQNSIPWVGVCLFNSRKGIPAPRSDSPRPGLSGSGDGRIPHPPSCEDN